MNTTIKPATLIKGILLLVLAIVIIVGASSMWETNRAGEYQVKQAFYTGTLSVRNEPGTYGQWFGDIHTYQITGDIFLSNRDEDGGDTVITSSNAAERVQFPNGYADVDFVGLYEIPLNPDIQKTLHIKYNNDANLNYMIKQQIIEALKNTGALMSAEEAYSSNRAEFVRLAREQALYGLYKADFEVDTATNEKHYFVAKGPDGKPIITKPSILQEYGIRLPQFNIKDMDFDPKLKGLIDARKDAQKAAQDAITAKASGDARIATEKATQEVAKVKEVTIAEKNKRVAELDAEKLFRVAEFAAKEAKENAKKIIAEGEAQAEANRLKVNAGLTPQERAEWEYKTKVGVAEQLAKINVPTIIAGGGSGGAINPFDAIGLKAIMDITDKMSDTHWSNGKK